MVAVLAERHASDAGRLQRVVHHGGGEGGQDDHRQPEGVGGPEGRGQAAAGELDGAHRQLAGQQEEEGGAHALAVVTRLAHTHGW